MKIDYKKLSAECPSCGNSCEFKKRKASNIVDVKCTFCEAKTKVTVEYIKQFLKESA